MAYNIQNNQILTEIAKLDTPQLMNILKKHGLGDCTDGLIKMGIDGEIFLNASESQVALWRVNLTFTQTKKLWSMIKFMKEQPQQFYMPPSLNKPIIKTKPRLGLLNKAPLQEKPQIEKVDPQITSSFDGLFNKPKFTPAALTNVRRNYSADNINTISRTEDIKNSSATNINTKYIPGLTNKSQLSKPPIQNRLLPVAPNEGKKFVPPQHSMQNNKYNFQTAENRTTTSNEMDKNLAMQPGISTPSLSVLDSNLQSICKQDTVTVTKRELPKSPIASRPLPPIPEVGKSSLKRNLPAPPCLEYSLPKPPTTFDIDFNLSPDSLISSTEISGTDEEDVNDGLSKNTKEVKDLPKTLAQELAFSLNASLANRVLDPPTSNQPGIQYQEDKPIENYETSSSGDLDDEDDEFNEFDKIEPRTLKDFTSEKWYRDIDRKTASSILENRSDGSFIVRPSNHPQNICTLMIICQKRVYNLAISQDESGKLVAGSRNVAQKTFTTVQEIIDYYRRNKIVLKHNNRDVFVTLKPF